MALVIKKRISLEFLGDEYKGAYLTFRKIPAVDYEQIDQRQSELKGVESLKYLVELLSTYFVEGKFPDESGKLAEVTKKDFDVLDGDTAVQLFNDLTGQNPQPEEPNVDPKDEDSSTTPSGTVPQPQVS